MAEISVPHSCSGGLTLRVDTPIACISQMANLSAFSERHPRSRDRG